jgi:serine/threonine protein kinase
VYRGEWEGAGVAVKEMRIPAANLSQEELELVLVEYKREVTRLCQLRHPNVLSFFGTVTSLPTLGIVTELMDKDMRRYLKSQAPNADPLAVRLGLARQAYCGVAYLHRRRLVHRDIKPENFLLIGHGAACVVKVCDFGLARVKEASHINTMRTAGTMTYIAPEVHRGEPFDERSDVYSLSIVTWELVTLQTPFSDKNMASIPGIVGWGQQRPSPLALDDSLRKASQSLTTQGEIRALISDGWSHDPAWRHTSQEGVTRLDACIKDLLAEEEDVTEMIAA